MKMGGREMDGWWVAWLAIGEGEGGMGRELGDDFSGWSGAGGGGKGGR